MKGYRTNLTSRAQTGTTVLEPNNNRSYFAVFPTTDGATIEFNEGGGLVPVAEGGFYEPYVVPTGLVEIIGTEYTVVTGS